VLGGTGALLDSGVRVIEQTPVHRVDPTGHSTVLSTPRGRVRGRAEGQDRTMWVEITWQLPAALGLDMGGELVERHRPSSSAR
jgi:hypothetical protein